MSPWQKKPLGDIALFCHLFDPLEPTIAHCLPLCFRHRLLDYFWNMTLSRAEGYGSKTLTKTLQSILPIRTLLYRFEFG